MKSERNLSRREFLQISALAGGGLALAIHLPGIANAEAPGKLAPNVWIEVAPDGRVIVSFAWNELGQGAFTSLTITAADELDADLDLVETRMVEAGRRYGNNITGGSSSMRLSWDPLRKAVAAAREMLREAAANRWDIPPAKCRTEKGRVLHPDGSRSLGYGELAAEAAALPIPENPRLKTAAELRLVGRDFPRLDTPDKVAGRTRFGIDQSLPGMLIAVAARCPVQGGTLKSFDEAAALAVAGVREVIAFDDWVAVLADHTWAAISGRDALSPRWDEGEHAGESSATLAARIEERSLQPAAVAVDEGDVAAAAAAAAHRLEAVYRTPLIAHAAMEPMNCVAHCEGDRCRVLVPTQASLMTLNAVAEALDIPPENVSLQPTFVGSAFGRRILGDFAVEAALLSRRAKRPVQIVWTREDDLRHDFYRPPSHHRLSAALDADGRVAAWTHRVTAPSISAQNFPGSIPEGGVDEGALDGAMNMPYVIPNVRVEYAMAATHLRIGWWRAVYNNQTAFANECFLDELAVLAGRDPVEMRLEMLGDHPRLAKVLRTAAEKAGWPRASAPNRFLGVACHSCFGSHAAQVAEVSVDSEGRPRVHRIVSVVDCGIVVNPDAVRAQMQGGAAMALGEALRGRIDIENGRVVQGNFDQYRLLDISEMPEVETHIIAGGDPIGGIGEPVVPNTAPAVCNAIFAATGKRIRDLPVMDQLGRT